MKDLQTLGSITSRKLVAADLVHTATPAVTGDSRSEPLNASALLARSITPAGAPAGPGTSRARVQVTPDWKPPRPEPKPPKPLEKTRGFRTSPKHLREQFRFAVLHEFGGRCILAALSEGEINGAAEAKGTYRCPEANREGSITPSESAAHVCDGPLDSAHLVPKQTLRKLGFPETVVFDHRNGVAACRRAHRRHDDGLERFPYELLPPSVFDFARDHGLTYLLDRLYPKKELA